MGLFGLGKYSQRAIERTARDLGLRPATMEEKYGEFVELKRHVEYMAEQGRLHEFEPLFRTYWEGRQVLPIGSPVYSVLVDWATCDAPSKGDDPSTFAGVLAPFEAEFRRNPTPLTAGLYADVLHSTAFALRGGAYASETSPEQWQGMQHYVGRALDVMASVDPGDDPVWWTVRHSMLLGDGSTPLQRHEIAEKALSLDPGNVRVLQRMAHHAMPRWYGSDATSIDRVARRAMTETAPLHGRGGYALVYWFLTGTGGYDLSDTLIERDLMVASCRDLLERFPNVMMRNLVARILSWSAIEDEVKAVFDAGLQGVVPMCWDEEDDDEGIEIAARAYLWARHNS